MVVLALHGHSLLFRRDGLLVMKIIVLSDWWEYARSSTLIDKRMKCVIVIYSIE